jgi:hypothetical protein
MSFIGFKKKKNGILFLKIGNNGNSKTNFIFWNFKDHEK